MRTRRSNQKLQTKAASQLKRFEEESMNAPRYAPLLSFARFGPGSIAILVLIVIATVGLYVWGFEFFAVVCGAIGILLFGAKSMEIIQLSQPEERKLIGQRCVVVKGVGKGRIGIVKVYDRNGKIDPELWSAESEYEIPDGQEAEVAGMRSIVLLIKPTE